MHKCVGVFYVSLTGVLCKRFALCVWAPISEYACVLHVNVLYVCVCACARVRCSLCRVLPELQATSAGGCSLITAINLATDRGRERQGAGGGGVLQAGGGWRKEGEKEV